MAAKKLKILFRTYGGKVKNKQTGLGHIFRCINLSYYLKQSADIHFLVEDYGGVKQIINDYGFNNFSSLKKNISLDADLKKTIQYIVKTVIITDLENVNLPVDILVNGYIGLKNQKYKNKHNSLCLVGPSYQILNQKFSKKSKSVRKKYDILITFGGLDERGIVNIFLDSLNENVKKLKIKIILGPIANKSKKVLQFSKKYSKNIEFVHETKNMYNEILKSKFGFTTGGVTTYEFASMNVPFAIICDDKHQIPTAKEWNKRKAGINLGFLDETTPIKINSVVMDILTKNMNHFFKSNLVDGLGAKRVSVEIFKIAKLKI